MNTQNCRFLFWYWHEWERWSDSFPGEMRFFSGKDPQPVSVQERRCSRCNMVQLRRAT